MNKLFLKVIIYNKKDDKPKTYGFMSMERQ